MYKKITSNGFSLRTHGQIAKSLFVFFNGLIFIVYGFLLLMFHEFPLDAATEMLFSLNLLGIGSGIALVVSILCLLADGLYCFVHHSKPMHLSPLSHTLQYTNVHSQPGIEI